MPNLLTLANWCGIVVVACPALLIAILGISSLLDAKLSERNAARCVYFVTVLGLIASLCVLLIMIAAGTRHVVVGPIQWAHVESLVPEGEYHFAFKFVFDRLSVPFVILTYMLVGTIGAFANRYMHRETGYNRFFMLYAIFLGGMVIAALSATIETLFLGWEMVGLSSAMLVGFFHDRPAPVRNALRVWIIYRVSDAAMLTAALLLHHMAGHGDLDFLTGYRHVGLDGDPSSWPYGICTIPQQSAVIVGVLLIIAAAGKSALLPFIGWLPRAMEGPTPSSAVFYGALSVHLGAFILLRISPLLDASIVLSSIVIALGLGTALVAALVGRVQTDIKSALSFASLTQVGIIVAEIGAGWFYAPLRYVPLVHLLGHACLRTLQFLRAPNVLHDRNAIEDAIGVSLVLPAKSSSGGFRNWLYRFCLERGYMDALLDRYFAEPFVRFFRWFDEFEVRLTQSPPSAAQRGESTDNPYLLLITDIHEPVESSVD